MTSLQDLYTTAKADYDQLGRVSHRVAMTDSEQLEKVLSLLLPRLLSRIGNNNKKTMDLALVGDSNSLSGDNRESVAVIRSFYQNIHAKLVEMLSHIIKRVRADGSCKLPCEAILSLLYNANAMEAIPLDKLDPYTINLSLTFLTIGIPRSTKDEKEILLPGLLCLLGEHTKFKSLSSVSSKNQINQIAHLTLRTVEGVVVGSRKKKNTNNDSSPLLLPSASLAGTKRRASVQNQQKNNHLEKARRLCSTNPLISAAIYDLLMDVLLCQSSAVLGGNLPPPGLSTFGKDRLNSGPSTIEKNWAAEYATHGRLKDLKITILDIIAPFRQWDLFNASKKCCDDEETSTTKKDTENDDALSIARVVSLLIASSGDQHSDVSDKATSYLKTHMDSRRNKTKSTTPKTNADGTAESSSESYNVALLGQPICLALASLRLVLGDVLSDNLIPRHLQDSIQTSLGLFETSNKRIGDTGVDKAIIISTKRRMVSDKSVAVILNFVASRIFDDIPKIFSTSSFVEDGKFLTINDPYTSFVNTASMIGSFVLAVTKKFAGSGRSLSGSSMTSSVGNASVAAARLLKSFCVRLVPFYDKLAEVKNDEHFQHHERKAWLDSIENILSRCFATSCAIVNIASSAHSGNLSNAIGVEARDAAYIVISTISRCNYPQTDVLLNCGESVPNQGQNLSINTASMLFGCLVNESESLKPRAIAALDSLLATYCRLVENHSDCIHHASTDVTGDESNPWMQNTKKSMSIYDTKVLSADIDFLQFSKILAPMLWNAAQPTQPKASRHAAAKWACDLLKPLDLRSASHLLCFVSGDSDSLAAGVAREGLGLSSQMGEDDILVTSKSGEELQIPEFADFIEDVFGDNERNSSSRRPTFWDFSPCGQGAALRFASMCLLSDLYGGDEETIGKFLSTIAEALCIFHTARSSSNTDRDSIELVDEASISLSSCLKSSQYARRKIICDETRINHRIITDLTISVVSSKSRRHLSYALGHLLEDSQIWNCFRSGQIHTEVFVENSEMDKIMEKCLSRFSSLRTNHFIVNEVHGSAYLGGVCIKALRNVCYTEAEDSEIFKKCLKNGSDLLLQLGNGLQHADEVIGNACANGIAIALTNEDRDAKELNKYLCTGAESTLQSLCQALKRFGNGDQTDASRASTLSKAAGIALAATTLRALDSQNHRIGKSRLECVESLFSLLGSSSYRKDPEMMLVVGEALALYADAYSPDGAQWTCPTKKRPENFELSYANELPPHNQVIYTLLQREMQSNSPHKKNSCAPVLVAFVARVTRMAHRDSSYINRAFCQEIIKNLLDIQVTFLSLLQSPKCKQLARESCCIGLSACYGLSLAISNVSESYMNGANRLTDRLLKAFGQSTNHGGSALMESRSQHEQRIRENNAQGQGTPTAMMEEFGMEQDVGGAAGISEAALGAYREMANTAVMLERPDILYSLMMLSVNMPIWTTPAFAGHYSPHVLLGTAGENVGKSDEIKKALQPYLANLIPRLLRACNDPNKQTREQMESLWIGLTGGGSEARTLINSHFLSTIDSLLEDATNKLWRARVGACNALAEIIVGRTWNDLGGGPMLTLDDTVGMKQQTAASRLLRLFRVTVRSLDDVRLTVRESGESLSRSLKSLTIRLCDSTTSKNDDALMFVPENEQSSLSAAATILPWLVEKGLNSPCQEAIGFSVACLLGIVEVSKPKTLEPVLPELISSLLMAMSGLEPAALNYLQTRAAAQDANRFEQLERIRLQMAQVGPIAGALAKCLDMVKSMQESRQSSVIPHIDSALRCGAGFATRAAAADAVSTLCTQCPSAFRFSGASMANPTVRLLRALYFASERERGAGARDKMIHAFGNLAALAPGSSVRSIAFRLCQRYKVATGSNDDPATRCAVAAALRAISVRASNQFGDGGSSDVWIKRVLPIAFMGRNDKDAGSLFEEVWNEGGQVANMTTNGPFAMQLQEKILPYLTKNLVDALNDVSWERRLMACVSLDELCKSNILAPAPRPLNHDTYAQKDWSDRDIMRSNSSKMILNTCVRLIVNTRMWTGKSNLVKTTVTIAANWVSLPRVDIQPGIPYVLRDETFSWDDLFIGDSWFEKNHNYDCCSSGVEDSLLTTSSLKEEDADQESDIDFAEGDKFLSNEDDPVKEEVTEVLSPDQQDLTLSGLSRVLSNQGLNNNAANIKAAKFYSDDALSYRAASLQALAQFLKCLEKSQHVQKLFLKIGPNLIPMISGYADIHSEGERKSIVIEKVPPLIIAKVIECLGSLIWNGMEFDNVNIHTRVDMLVKLLTRNCSEIQRAWTIREASAIAVSNICRKTKYVVLTKMDVLDDLLSCARLCPNDKKFWKVRYAKLLILKCLCNRAERNDLSGEENQLMLEALLPMKESIVALAKSNLQDSEARVTAMSSEILASLAWWP